MRGWLLLVIPRCSSSIGKRNSANATYVEESIILLHFLRRCRPPVKLAVSLPSFTLVTCGRPLHPLLLFLAIRIQIISWKLVRRRCL
ncbi:hypothetical protein C8R48DRAFT_699167 [Suillus tomentosus]|nr:hypothetical protein C8R48DRAFT_699167 [Suillus tomentosus]